MILWSVTVAWASGPPCLDEARRELGQVWPEAAEAVAPSPDVFASFLRCDGTDLGLRGAVHESVHAVSGPDPASDAYRLIAPGAEPVTFVPVATMPAARVSGRLAKSERTSFHDAYLTGPSGDQPLRYLLDELNAYTWTLELARRLQPLRPLDNMRSSDRDGLAAMQWFVLLYLDELERRAPEEHAAVVASDTHRAALVTLFDRATAHLAATCTEPALGIEDGYWLARVYGEPGQRTYRAVTGATLTLPETCAPVVAAAPKRPRPADTKAELERAMLTRRTVKETVTITVDGEDLTLEEIEARAADDPQWQQILEQVKAQLETVEPEVIDP